MTDNEIIIGLAAIIVLGVGSQWIGKRTGIPSLLLLLPAGLLAGDVSGLVQPEEMFGDLLFPLVSLLLSLLLFQSGLGLRSAELPREARGPVLRLLTIGMMITFAGAMSEPANRAALAFRAAVNAQDWPEVLETSTSLVSTYLEVDLATTPPDAMKERLRDLLKSRDWFAADLPSGRTLWHVPTVYGTDLGPQLEEAANVAGVDPDTAIKQLSESRVRVLTIGFAPGQPYMGELSKTWDIPRQQGLSKSVPAGALVIAIQQLIVFTNDTPTGWRHIGQTAFRCYRPEAEDPFALRPGDLVSFDPVSSETLTAIRRKDATGNGGAKMEMLS